MQRYLKSAGVFLDAERASLLYWSAVLYGAGIGLYFLLPFEPPLWPVIIALIALGFFHRQAKDHPEAKVFLRGALIALAGFGVGALRVAMLDTQSLDRDTGAVEVAGIITLVEDRIEGGMRLTLKAVTFSPALEQTAPIKIRITVRTAHGDLYPGMRIKTRAMLLPLPEPVLPGGYDFGRHLWFQGLGGVGFAIAPIDIIAGTEASWSSKVETFRQNLANRITASAPGPEGAIAAALITGIRDDIPEYVRENMRIAGLAHLLAISGLHMALVTGALFFALRAGMAAIPALALRYPIRKFAAVGAFIGAAGYLILSGASISTQRAFIMVTIILLAVLTDRQAISMRLVALAAILVLTLSPEAILHPSFQMSFAAVTGLVAGYTWLQPKLTAILRRDAGYLSRFKLYLTGIFLSTLIAEVSIGPIAFYHFGRFSAYGLLANMAAVPVMGFWVMPVGLIALALVPFGLDAWAWQAMAAGIGIIIDVAATVAALPGADFKASEFPFNAFVFFIGAGLWLCLWKAWRIKRLFLAPFVVGLMVYFSHNLADVVISAEGDLVAIKGPDGRFYFNTLRRSKFDRKIWQQHFGQIEALSFQDFPTGQGPMITCDPLGCLFQSRNGIKVALS